MRIRERTQWRRPRRIKSIIDIPEGSTLKDVLKKYKIFRDKQKVIILINRKPCYDNNFVLKNGDTVALFPPLAGG
ncbi:MAG: MoaD/ThiS family protein [Promethearchaeota archaeon]